MKPKTALIVAHGQPSSPREAGQELEELVAKIAVLMPGWQLEAATLAEKGQLEAKAAALGGGVVFPMFIASGWFTKSAIPARLADIAGEWRILPPFGEAAAVQELALDLVRQAGAAEVLIAAHGSFKSRVPSDLAHALAAKVAQIPGVRRAEAAFIDQPPRLAEVTGFGAEALCLPYFAMAGGHIRVDLPAALAEAGFVGTILPPLGLDPRVPARIAEIITASVFCDEEQMT